MFIEANRSESFKRSEGVRRRGEKKNWQRKQKPTAAEINTQKQQSSERGQVLKQSEHFQVLNVLQA